MDGVVHPGSAKCRAVAAFMPARIGRRAVKHAVTKKEGNAEPRAPKPDPSCSEDDEQRKPKRSVADRRRVRALNEFFHRLARHVGVMPFGRGQARPNVALSVRDDEAVIARLRRRGPKSAAYPSRPWRLAARSSQPESKSPDNCQLSPSNVISCICRSGLKLVGDVLTLMPGSNVGSSRS